MRKSLFTGIVLGGLMVLSAALAKVAAPTVKIADTRPLIVLKTAIPEKFGDWEEDRTLVANVVNPTAQEEIDKIYAQTLSRTYVNKNGERMMLSIAYGTDQRDNLAIHFPEGCYGGQGFAVSPTVLGNIQTVAGVIPTAKLVATQTTRNEPITYWVVVGEKAVYDAWEVKKIKLSYALKGLIPDATLMRVSNITQDNAYGYRQQNDFINAMLAAMTPAHRRHFAGTGE